MSKGSKQRPTDKSKYDSTYDKIFKQKQKQAIIDMIEWDEDLDLYEIRNEWLAVSSVSIEGLQLNDIKDGLLVGSSVGYEVIFKDPEREAFDLINKCSTLEEAQECLHREKDNRGWELYNKKYKYKPITTKQNYNTLLNSGMFWELYPELTGEWDKDKDNIF
jgi:hypothetical protein